MLNALEGFLNAMPVVAASPLAFLCYLVLAILSGAYLIQKLQVTTYLKSISGFSGKEKAKVVQRKTSDRAPRDGFSAQQFLHFVTIRFLFWSYVSTILAIVVISAYMAYHTRVQGEIEILKIESESNSLTNSRDSQLQTPAEGAGAYTVATIHRIKQPSRFFELKRNSRILPSGQEFFEPITFHPIGGDKERFETGVKKGLVVPHLLESDFGTSADATAFLLLLQNVGTEVEPHASITITMNDAYLWKQRLFSPDRMVPSMQLSEQSLSAIAGFSVANLLPGERLLATIYSKSSGPFNAEWFSTGTSEIRTPMIFDILIGEPEVAPSLPTDPKFDQKHFPFR